MFHCSVGFPIVSWESCPRSMLKNNKYNLYGSFIWMHGKHLLINNQSVNNINEDDSLIPLIRVSNMALWFMFYVRHSPLHYKKKHRNFTSIQYSICFIISNHEYNLRSTAYKSRKWSIQTITLKKLFCWVVSYNNKRDKGLSSWNSTIPTCVKGPTAKIWDTIHSMSVHVKAAVSNSANQTESSPGSFPRQALST